LPINSPRKASTKGDKIDIPLEFASDINYNEDESTFTTFMIQTKALTWKNFCIFTRKYQVIFFLLMAPLCVAYLLNVMVGIGDTLGSMGYTDGKIDKIGPVERCLTGKDVDLIDWIKIRMGFDVDLSYVTDGCTTVGYGFIGDYTDVNAP